MKEILAKQFALPETAIRVMAHDVGGSYGIKIHVYPDEMAAIAIAILLARPVKFVADRLESFTSDIHAPRAPHQGAHGGVGEGRAARLRHR